MNIKSKSYYVVSTYSQLLSPALNKERTAQFKEIMRMLEIPTQDLTLGFQCGIENGIRVEANYIQGYNLVNILKDFNVSTFYFVENEIAQLVSLDEALYNIGLGINSLYLGKVVKVPKAVALDNQFWASNEKGDYYVFKK